MWRLQVFLLLSTCFLIPYEAKPANSSTTSAPPRRTSHIGRLAAKDLADLLAASMQARGLKLTESQQATVKSLRTMEPTEPQGGAVLLQLGMDVIIDVLIGSSADASCERVLKDIKKSSDKNSLTLSLKSFLALCAFNGIECSQKQVVQIIKGTTAHVKSSETALLGSRSTRTALESAGKSASIKGDRDTIVNFLQARSLSELSVILSTLLQVCGASSLETQSIVQNLIEMGPKDNSKNTGVSVLQINGFSTLIVSLMDSLTSIANGNKSGFCAATPESWIVRLLDMGVAKVIIMGLMTALDRSLPIAPNSIMPKGSAVGNLVDVPLTKGSATAKRSSGSLPFVGNLLGNSLPTDALTSGLTGNIANQGGNILKTGPTNVLSGDNNSVDTLANVAVPILAGVNVLNSVTGLVGGATGGGTSGGTAAGSARNVANAFGNNVLLGPENVISGSGNKVSTLVGGRIPVAADVNVLNSVTGLVGGATGGGTSSGTAGAAGGSAGNIANSLGNKVLLGPENVINGSGNRVSTLVDGRIPVAADVNILNSVLGTVTGATGGSGGLAGGVLGGATGGVLGGSSQNIANKGGNSITMHPKNVINGTGNSITKLVDADIVLDLGVNLLNSVVGTVTGDSGTGSAGSAGGSAAGVGSGAAGRAQNIANKGGNTIITDPKNVVTGSGNSITELANVAAPLAISANVLNSVVGTVTGASGGSSGGAVGGLLGGVGGATGLLGGITGGQNIANQGGNVISTGPDNIVTGQGNSIFNLAKVALPLNVGVNVLNSVLGAVTGAGAPRDDVVQVLDRHGNLLMEIWDKDNVTARTSGVGNDLSNTLHSGPKQIIMGDDNTIARAVNLDLSGLALLDLGNAIRGSSGACNGIANKFDNELSTGPDTVISGNNNRVVTLLNLKLSALARLSALNRIIGTVGNDCPAVTSTPAPPTPSPPTPSPPTPSPPTPSPPTPSPPTPSPPTPSPPTPSPPTPNPNKCYRRYCRKWRTRPSYLCQKNCGGAYVYRP